MTVTAFFYLGWILTPIDDNCPAVIGSLHKLRLIWVRLSLILGREREDARTSGNS